MLGRMLKAADKYIAQELGTSYDQTVIEHIMAEKKKEYSALLPTIPDLGGMDNPVYTLMLYSAVNSLAFFKAMEKRAVPAEKTGGIIVSAFEKQMFAYPLFLRRLFTKFAFSGFALCRLKKRAEASEIRRYPGAWVFRYLDGEAGAFDYGVDYTECAIVKFYRAHGAESLVKYCCLLDFPMSKALHWGLTRTTTLAEGFERCDFRFKKGLD